MSTANSEFSQVWCQVKAWPVEFRQDLVDEITKSVESDLSATPIPWNDAKGQRRCELIDKEIQGTLDESEKRELALLTSQLRAHRRRVAPLPIDAARQLHKQLVDQKNCSDTLFSKGK